MTEKIIDPRLYEIDFEKKQIPIFIVPKEKNKATSQVIKKEIKNEFNIEPEINDLTSNLYFMIRKNQVPSLIEYVKGSDLVKSLEMNDMSKEGMEFS
ncbi:hypothetical protein C9439_06170 [archaeon SCG-AAA382B04]|nr:hypothetical protein C9439_06170 [archaeon SCG-AAA382B04]